MPSIQDVSDISHGHIAARCLHVIAELNVADAIRRRRDARSMRLRHARGANADALGRVLRLLAAHGLFANAPDGWVHTPASRLSAHRSSAVAALLRPHERNAGDVGRLHGSQARPAATGKAARDWASLVAYFAEHPEESSLFNAAMLGKSQNIVPPVVAAYDFGRFATIADVGGGRGHLPHGDPRGGRRATTGILFELPHVIADARDAEVAAPAARRGRLLRDPLPSADAYVLMEVVHDWANDDAMRILTAVRRAAPRTARMLIVETLVSESPEARFGKTLDIIMLAVTGGRERTRSEYSQLLAATGWRLTEVIATPTRLSIVEAVVA